MADTSHGPAHAGASLSSSLSDSLYDEPTPAELLRTACDDALRHALALQALTGLLRGCDAGHLVPATGLLCLLEPITSGLEMLHGDLLTAAHHAPLD